MSETAVQAKTVRPEPPMEMELGAAWPRTWRTTLAAWQHHLSRLFAWRSPPPPLFSALFWATLIGVHIVPAFGVLGEYWRFGFWWTAAMSLLLVVVWLALPWQRTASPWHKSVALLFPVAVMLLDQTLGDSVWADSNYLIAIANGILLFGVNRAVLFAVWVLFCHFSDYLFNSFYPPYQLTWSMVLDSFFWTAVYLPYAVFAVGVSLLYLTVLRNREDTQSLLNQLAVAHDDLQAAHAELNHHLQQVRELVLLEERARIAREIHDTLGHHLTAITLQLEHARRLRDRDVEAAWQEVSDTKVVALEALTEVRRSVRALKPLALEERTGLGALAALSRSFEAADLEVAFTVQGTPRDLSAEVELTLYRALQASLTNAVRHAAARRVISTLTFEANTVQLRVEDDGLGVAGGLVQEGFGLSAVRERVALLDGQIFAGNGAKQGFVVAVTIPSPPGAAR